MKMSKYNYKEIIAQDIKWLNNALSNKDKESLEYQHIIAIIEHSVKHEYPEDSI